MSVSDADSIFDDVDQNLEEERQQLSQTLKEDNNQDLSDIEDSQNDDYINQNIKSKKEEQYPEISDDEDSPQEEKQFQISSKQQKIKNYEESEEDDQGQQQEITNLKRKKNSKGSKGIKKRQTEDNSQPKQSKKDQKEDQIQKNADNLVERILKQMDEAYSKDEKSKVQGRPAFKRIQCIDNVEKALRNGFVKESFLEEQGLDKLYQWLSTIGNNITLRKKILKLVKNLKINTRERLENNLCIHFLDMKQRILNKSKEVNKLDQETKRLYIDIVDGWGAIIKTSNNNEEQDD